MVVDETPRFPEMRSVHVDDADAVAQQALAAGAKLIMEVQDKPYGGSGGVKDPFTLDCGAGLQSCGRRPRRPAAKSESWRARAGLESCPTSF
jgi:hypothetical protein